MLIFIFSKWWLSPSKGHLSFFTLVCRSLKICNSAYNYFVIISCVCAIGSRNRFLFVTTYFSFLGKCSDSMMDGSTFPKICLWLWKEHHRNLSSIYFFVAKSLMIRLCNTPQQSLGPRHWEITETKYSACRCSVWAFQSKALKKDEVTFFPG